MSQSLPAVTGREVLKALVGVGFVHVSTKGSHAKIAHPDGRVAVVPRGRPAGGEPAGESS
ncbi:MAG: type II toxin-antitoxin system HicA family toxin [Pseudonocardiaceae bacterium]